MAILADRSSRILLHGIANPLARFQCNEMLKHETGLVGIVDAGLAENIAGVPAEISRFCNLREAADETKVDIVMVFDEPLKVKHVVREVIEAGIKTVVCFTEHVPVLDAIDICHRARDAGVRLIGPNSSGFLSPGLAKVGFFVEDICMRGGVGVVTKSGSLSYAVLSEMKSHGIGVSTVVAIGGDRVKGSTFSDILPLFEADAETGAIVLLGEIGGDEEELAAECIRSSIGKPVVGFLTGKSLPLGVSLGHAGAIARMGKGDYESKVKALRSVGVQIANDIGEIPVLLERFLSHSLAL